jgi:hypothetical protein
MRDIFDIKLSALANDVSVRVCGYLYNLHIFKSTTEYWLCKYMYQWICRLFTHNWHNNTLSHTQTHTHAHTHTHKHTHPHTHTHTCTHTHIDREEWFPLAWQKAREAILAASHQIVFPHRPPFKMAPIDQGPQPWWDSDFTPFSYWFLSQWSTLLEVGHWLVVWGR